MKKIFILIFIIILFSNITVFAKTNSPAAVVLKAKGEIVLHRQNTNSQIESGEVLYSGDQLLSKEESMAAIRFVDDGAIIKLFSNSILSINTEKKVKKLDKKLFLEIGDLWSKVTKEKGMYQIQTPTSVAAVKGTNFYTNVKEDGETMVITFAGIVELRTNVGSKDVEAGNTGIAKEGEMPTIEETKPEQISKEIKEEIEQEKSSILELNLKNEDGETKTLRIYLKNTENE